MADQSDKTAAPVPEYAPPAIEASAQFESLSLACVLSDSGCASFPPQDPDPQITSAS